jgi:hypothetical protein
MLNKLHCHFWFRINMVHAYLAYHRGDKIACAEYENEANRYESELIRMEVCNVR